MASEDDEPDDGHDDLEDDDEKCPECGAHVEEHHAWDCSRGDDEEDDDLDGL